MVSQNAINNTVADNDFSVNRATAATSVVSTVAHSDNTAVASNASLNVTVGGTTSTGDPFVHLQVTGSTEYSIGIDNSDADYLKLTSGASPSVGTAFMTLNPVTPSILWDIHVINQWNAAADSHVYNQIYNSEAGATVNHATQIMTVESTSTGDPYTMWTTHTTATSISVTQFVMGIDNSDADSLKMGVSLAIADPINNTPSSTTNFWKMTTAGERTMPLQPAFLAYNSDTDANQTGNAAVATVDFDTEVFDQGADFAGDTFTSPVTGKCFLSTNVIVTNITAAMTQSVVYIITSNRNYDGGYQNAGATKDSADILSITLDVLADMDAADTSTVTVQLIHGAGNTAGIHGVATPATRFSGNLQV